MLLNRQAILAAQDLKTERVEVPEWGGAVLISTMTGTDRNAWEQTLVSVNGKVNLANASARLVAFCAVDENGQRLFTDADAVELGQKSSAALQRCVNVAQRLNGLTAADMEEAKGN